MHGGRATPPALLALLYGVSGALCLLGAARPMSEQTPVTLLRALAVAGLGGGALLWWLGARARPAVLHAAVALLSLLIGLLAWRSATAVGIVGLGPVQLAVGLYAAHFFSLRAVRLHVLLLVAAASAGALAARPSGFWAAWLPLVVATVAITEMQARLADRLRTAATTDPLTGVRNRRAWEQEAERSLAHATRTGEALSVVIVDLDDFKRVNDRQGHGAGDDLLRELTGRWRHLLRRADVLGRYGGDEFMLCLPDTDRAGATELLQRLAAAHPFPWSSGIALAEPDDTVSTVLARADADMYRQKQGRHEA